MNVFAARQTILHRGPSLRAATIVAIAETTTKAADVMQYGHSALITKISMMVRYIEPTSPIAEEIAVTILPSKLLVGD